MLPVGEDVEIFIPSRSRFKRSLTLEALAHGGLADRAVLVVPYDQATSYVALAKRYGVKKILRCRENGIAATRKFIGERAVDKFVMFDDDLRFTRRMPGATSLHMFGPNDFGSMMILLSRVLDHYKHASIGAREGNNRMPVPLVEVSRPLRALAYRKREFMRCVHGRVAVMEDFDVTLQLLKQGFANAVITEYTQDQAHTQLPGGCSDYRTKELHETNVRKMAALHPGIVKLRDKENKTGGDFGKRLEATIYWNKAYQSAFEEVI